MKKTIRRVFATLMAMVIAFTAIPMMEVKAAEGDILVNITLDNSTELVITNENPHAYITASVEVTGTDKEIQLIEAIYTNKETEEEIYVYFWYIAYGNYTAEVGRDHSMSSGVYELERVKIHFEDGFLLNSDIPEDGLVGFSDEFTVKNTADQTLPVISNVSMTPVGEELEVGDTITITATVTDEYSFGELSVNAFFIGNDGSGQNFMLEKVSGDTYEAEIVLDEKFAGSEWYLQEIDAFDTSGNCKRYSPMDEGKKYNVFVVDANGEYEKVIYENVSFIFTDENGEYNEADRIVLPEVTPIISISDILGEDSEPTSEVLGNFVGWSINDSDELYSSTDKFGISYYATEFMIRPVFEYKSISVIKAYIDENGEQTIVESEIFMPTQQKATYQDVIDKVSAPASLEGLTFLGWTLDGGSAPSEELVANRIHLNAEYKEMVVFIDCLILDEENASWTDYQPYVFEKNTTYGDVLNKVPAPEDKFGCTFLNWEYSDEMDVKLTDKVDSECMIDLYAVYDKYPVFINKIYADNNGEIKTEKIKDIYPAGTKLEDIVENYTDIPTDAKTDGITWLKEYENGEIDIRNNEIILIADYEEQMIVGFDLNYIEQGDGYGLEVAVSDFFLADKMLCENEETIKQFFAENVIQSKEFKHFTEWEFIEWRFDAFPNETGYYNQIIGGANYDSSKVITVEMKIGENDDFERRYYVVEAGDVITLPTEFAGYYLTWEGWNGMSGAVMEINDNKFIVPSYAGEGNIFVVYSQNGDKVPEQITPPGEGTPPGEATPPASDSDVPKTGDSTNVLPYLTLLLLGAGVYMVGNKRRHFVR